MSRLDIRDRIDCALEKMRCQGMEVRSIYLDDADLKSLGQAIKFEWGFAGQVHACGYRDHIVRSGRKSIIYSTHGVATAIPKKLSHRVAERIAA